MQVCCCVFSFIWYTVCVSVNMHSFLSKETGCVVIGLGLGGRGRDSQTCSPCRQVRGPDKPCQALTLEGSGRLRRKGYLANYKLLTKKKSNTWPFSQRGRRVRTQWPFDESNFCSAFHKICFCYPSKILCHYRHYYYYFFLFKIRSQYTWFSLFWLCTEVQKSQPLSPCRLEIPHPIPVVWSWLSEGRVCTLGSLLDTLTWPHQQRPPKKWSNMQLVFQHGPISRESTNIKTIFTIWNGYSRK